MKAVIAPGCRQPYRDPLEDVVSAAAVYGANVNRPQSEPTSRFMLPVWGEITFHKEEGTFDLQRSAQVRNQPWNERKLSMLLPPQTSKLNVLTWWCILVHLDVSARGKKPQVSLINWSGREETTNERENTPTQAFVKTNYPFKNEKKHQYSCGWSLTHSVLINAHTHTNKYK